MSPEQRVVKLYELWLCQVCMRHAAEKECFSKSKAEYRGCSKSVCGMCHHTLLQGFERYMLSTLVDELNSLFPLSLATDFVCDRFLDEDVFDETKNHTALVVIGASHLRNVASLISTSDWQVFDLTTPGWRITDHAINKKTDEIIKLGEQIELEKATVILQLYDNSVFLVGGTGGTRHLPV
jgi:hypothetical protein